MDFIRRIYINGRGLEAGQCCCEILGQSPFDNSDVKTCCADTNMGLLQDPVHEFYISDRRQSAGEYIYQNVR